MYVKGPYKGPGKSKVLIPTNAFWERKRSFLEGIVWWLREEKGMRYSEIGRMLDRDQRNIWTAYDRAKNKLERAGKGKKVSVPSVSLPIVSIPIQVLCDRSLSIMESAVLFLREQAGMSNQQVATVLRRSRKTVSTVYVRSKKKKESGNEKEKD